MDDLRKRLSRIRARVGSRTCVEGLPPKEEGERAGRISSMREQLERIKARGSGHAVGLLASRERPRLLEEVLNGDLKETDLGHCYEMVASYRHSFRHGGICLNDFNQVDLSRLDAFCGGTGEKEISPEEVLFVDLETTGLSHGAGTYAFLVGFGYFEGGRYHIRQLFLRDFREEPALLDRALQIMKPFRFLAHFNGKSFDMPLLETRFTMCGMEARANDWCNWDLLYPARRLWKGRVEDCRLETLEASKLSVKREGRDIRGDRIPEVYLRYVHSGDARELDRVVYHNAVDMLSLATLTIHIDRNLREKDPEDMDLLRTARYYERQGLADEGLTCFRIASDRGESEEEREIALLHIARRMKKGGDFVEAVRIWEELIRQGSVYAIDCCEELAKYHEHQTRDLERAIQAVERALDINGIQDAAREALLRRRLERLMKKRGESWGK